MIFFLTLNKSVKSYLLAILAAEEHRLKCIDDSGILYNLAQLSSIQPNPTTGNHKFNYSLAVNYILCCRKL
ncbi:3-demethylubiquinone-9 3-methyltransferase, truncated [Colwellia psychrerythraea 34H]|nr:3-demethylubiquinone-9 3-methyltransferase, truncated [Colwellia psychrerythraea 34H]